MRLRREGSLAMDDLSGSILEYSIRVNEMISGGLPRALLGRL